MIFKYAIDYLGLSQTPVKSQICKPEKSTVDFWTPDEYKIFSDHIQDRLELYTAFEILFYTGMRKGELLALTLNDIDFNKKTININKTLVYVNGEYTTQPPKTLKSRRTIEVPEFLLDEIKAYSEKIYGLDLKHRLFHRSLEWLGISLKGICAKIGLKPIRVHDLRHPYVKPTTKKFTTFLRISGQPHSCP